MDHDLALRTLNTVIDAVAWPLLGVVVVLVVLLFITLYRSRNDD